MTILVGITSTAIAAVLIFHVVKLIMRQIKLNHSINLVELKTSKLVYWVFAGIIAFLIFYIIMQMGDAEAPSVVAFAKIFGVGRTLTNIALMFPLIVMIAAEAFVIILALGRNAVVDKGVYTNFSMLDWHQVHDYIIDEDKGVLVLSSNKNTFATLKNLTTPFKVSSTDIPKLKFILNKNKNKFSGFEDDGTPRTFSR